MLFVQPCYLCSPELTVLFTFHPCQRPNCPDLDFASMTEEYPRFPDIHDLHIEFEDQIKIMVRFLKPLRPHGK